MPNRSATSAPRRSSICKVGVQLLGKHDGLGLARVQFLLEFGHHAPVSDHMGLNPRQVLNFCERRPTLATGQHLVPHGLGQDDLAESVFENSRGGVNLETAVGTEKPRINAHKHG